MKWLDGIHSTITRTDVAHQRVDGWVEAAGRFVWLHDAHAQQPTPFTSGNEQRAYQVIFTRVPVTEPPQGICFCRAVP